MNRRHVDINTLIRQGYSEEEIERMLDEIDEKEKRQRKTRREEPEPS